MRFPYELSAALIGTTAAIVMFQPQIAQALTAEELTQQAKEITVLIKNNKSPLTASGSGVIIGKSGSNPQVYYVLTAYHVVKNRNLGENQGYTIVTPENQSQVNEEIILDYSTVQQLTDENGELVDLAILQFTSDRDYRIATLANYDLKSQVGSNTSQMVFASGWPAGREQPQRLFSPGLRVGKDLAAALASRSIQLGYELLYTSITYPGMSGGPVLDANGYVIAIHGQSEGDKVNEVEAGTNDFRVRLGYSMGIPIQTFLSHQTAREIETALQITTEAPRNLSREEMAASLVSFLPETPEGERAEDPRSWVNYGNELWRIGDVFKATGNQEGIKLQNQAIAAYDIAIEKAPSFYQAWLARGNVFIDLGGFENALISYEKAIETFPYEKVQKAYQSATEEEDKAQAKRDLDLYASLWRYKGLALSKLNRYDEAVAAFEKVLEVNETDFVALDLKGFAQMELGDNEAALVSFERAIELKPEYIFAWIHKGDALAKLDRLPAAVAAYEQVLKIQPNYYNAAFQRADVLAEFVRRNGHNSAALTKILAINLEEPDGLTRLGLAQFGLRDREGAIATFTEATDRNRNDAAAWAAKGLTLIVENRYAEARLAFEKALEINPKDPATLEALAILNQLEQVDDSQSGLGGVLQ
jgi:tetratricopeptide (TPR) repeat protein/V8-like Glu-specific endopeptidase